MGKTVFTFILLIVCLHQVYSSCWVSSNPPDPKDPELHCSYKGYKMRSGSRFESPAPFCDDCTCDGMTLSCCKYGAGAGVFSIQGCVHVPIEGSCELNLRKSDDVSQPCFELL